MGDKLEKKKALGITSFEKNKVNPFVEKAIEDIKIVQKRQIIKSNSKSEIQAIVNNDGEVTGHTAFMRFIEVDEEKFTKFYLSQFEQFWELPKSAIRVFGYIMTKLKPKEDKFEFLIEECMEHSKYTSIQPIYTGLVSLCENNIIARGYNEYTYFINPLVAFNGDRVTFAKTYIKKKKATANPNQISLF